MSSAIYKSGQGYWVRLMLAIAYGVVIVLGLNWLWGWLETMSFGDIETVYVQVAAVLVFAVVFGLIGFSIIGIRKRTVEFFIATEGEMKKVNWSSKRELNRSTWAVIAFTVGLALFCFAFDKIFFVFFYWTGVLDASSTS